MWKHLRILTITTIVFGLFPYAATGQSNAELQGQIDAHNKQIQTLNKEITAFEKQLKTVSTQKQTLQNTLVQLDLQRKKISASINVTKNKIGALQLEIQQLSKNIRGKEESISVGEAGLGETIRRLNEAEELSLVVAMLSSEDINTMWTDIDSSYSLQDAMQRDIRELSEQKEVLTDTKTATEEKQSELKKQQNKLVGEQGSLDATRKAQNDLLAQTKSQEANYQALLREKQAAKASIEAALTDLQAKFQYNVDPSKVPAAGKGILRWPLDTVKITQGFGDTAFARSGAYAGKGHNGIDFGASVGTPIKASLTGTVAGTGNTDAVPGCYSYGKWVLLKHGNGLATLYAHMSQVNVSQGQSVATGQVIGYSGATGYATGPHLHFGVYVGSATQIIKLGEATNRVTPCASAVMPVAPLSAYLNPIEYL